MCLAVPVLIQTVEGAQAVVELGGVKRTISLMLTPEAEVGNYVLVHAGYAIGIVDEEEAKETLHLLEEMAAFTDQDDT
jgi:hydrogenase expression/formation protein HypC